MTRSELDREWSLIDWADATETLDALEDADARAAAKAKAEGGRRQPKGRLPS